MAGLADLLNAHSQAQPSGVDSYLMKLLSDAEAQYPYLKQYNLKVVAGKSNHDDFAETWHPGDPGDPSYPRDPRIPLNRAGVTVYKTDQFRAPDLAAEGLHLDPVSMMIRQRMLASLNPAQTATLQNTKDYRQSVADKAHGGFAMAPTAAMSNGIDSALRSAVFGQAADATPQAMRYTPQQQGLLSTLQHYVTTGHQ